MSASALISIGFSNHGVSIIKFCDLVKKYGAIAVDFEHALEMAKQLLADKDFMNKHVDPCAHK